ncbi:MAG TPA: radical SAM protein [Anaerolineae bacterium]|nr:radical SAM protein [Anaerolineae bacterium]
MSRIEGDIGELVKSGLWMWGRSNPKRMTFFLRIAWRLWRAERRRVRQERTIGTPIPTVLAISPTMRCNYNCQGCYSRTRSTTHELTSPELDAIFTEAEGLGVLAVVVTGGEPMLRGDMVDLMARHRGLLFVPITNGSLVSPNLASKIAESGNILTLVSVEGLFDYTDERRMPGAFEAAVRAMEHLNWAGACFGFSAMNTACNTEHLGSDKFVDEMIALGCSVGFFTEYVPCGPNPRRDWVLEEETRLAFRRRVLELRASKPIVLVQFPHDEYGQDGLCSAAGRRSLHISSEGDVEPCPFVPLSCENVRRGGLLSACRSPFLRAIREHPDLLRRQKFACSLFEHRAEVEKLLKHEKGQSGHGSVVVRNLEGQGYERDGHPDLRAYQEVRRACGG